MDTAQFNLRWNNHSFNIVQVFLEQLSSESLVDVTLSCQGQFLKAHKMVLSACSSYFQDLFNVHEAQHPVIILNGIKFHDLKMVVEFMYKGETRVLESELNGILAVAEALQVKGLSNVRDVQSITTPDGCFPSVDMSEDFVSECHAEDPLEVSSDMSESLKPGRKRKRVSEANKTGAAKLQRSEAGICQTEVSQQRVISPKLPSTKASSSKTSSQKPSAPKATSPKTSSPIASLKTNLHQVTPSETNPLKASLPTSPETPASQYSSEALSSRGISPSPSEFQSHTISSSEEPSTVSTGKAATGMSKTQGKVYPSKRPLKVESSSTSATSPHQLIQGNDEIPPFAQVALNDLPDEDNDLATTIKVEPLFIRDIDDNDTSWDDPTRLVIDLPSEDSEGKKSESNSPGGKSNCEETHVSVNMQGVRVSAKTQLKVRPASELVAADEACRPSDPLSLEENIGKGVELPKERLKGDRIPRPPNAFMIFANEWRKKLALENKTESNKQISVRLGMKWKGLNAENKEVYFCAARRADEEHKRKYPGYFYSPKEARIRKAMRGNQRQPRLQTVSSHNSEQPAKKSKGPKHPNESLFIADAHLVVKEEMLEEEPNPQNLEEEFLNMVEDGQVEAEAEVKGEERRLNCEQSDQEASVDNQT